ncbi:MAG: bis-aminopropyl spermidine synthase family protein [Euryarchaeota archaeon]|nr:bis-aminopropyl spermidine synthase family protein [Euryarchaeota archaeon]
MKEQVARMLGKRGRNFWELLSRWEYRIKDFVDAVNEMYSSGEVVVKNGRLLPSRGLASSLPSSLPDRTCGQCRGRGVEVRNTALLRRFRALLRERPHTTAKYFQGNMDAESVVARVYLMDSRDGLAGKRITLVGDDDYLSLALALTRLPSRIVVLEIDERIGEFIERCSRRHGLEVEYVPYNVEQPLPKELRGRSHIFSTEPLETLSGFLTFFARGAAALRKRGVGYVGLTNLECSLEKWKRIQESILRMGFVITDIKRRFSFYPMEYPEDAEYVEQVLRALKFRVSPRTRRIWYFSHLFRVEAVEEIKPEPAPDEEVSITLFDEGDDFTYPN